MEILNFPRVHTGYQDREERSVCAGCGSNYVVQPEQLKQAQEITDDMYEALTEILIDFDLTQKYDKPSLVRTIANKALAKAEGN